MRRLHKVREFDKELAKLGFKSNGADAHYGTKNYYRLSPNNNNVKQVVSIVVISGVIGSEKDVSFIGYQEFHNGEWQENASHNNLADLPALIEWLQKRASEIG